MPESLSFLGDETGEMFANLGMNLLWITMFVKPVFFVLMKYTELKTPDFPSLWKYLKTFKGRSLK